MLATFSLVFIGLFFFVTSKSVYYQRLVEFSEGTLQRWGLSILKVRFDVYCYQFFINSQETTATTGISDLLWQAVFNLIQSHLESSLSQDLLKRSLEEEEKLHLQFYFRVVL